MLGARPPTRRAERTAGPKVGLSISRAIIKAKEPPYCDERLNWRTIRTTRMRTSHPRSRDELAPEW